MLFPDPFLGFFSKNKSWVLWLRIFGSSKEILGFVCCESLEVLTDSEQKESENRRFFLFRGDFLMGALREVSIVDAFLQVSLEP